MARNARYYRGVAVEYQLATSSGNTPQIAVAFDILCDSAGKEVPERRLVWYGFFSDAATEITLKALRAMGWQGDDLSAIDSLPNEVELVVEDEEFEGRVRTKVQFVQVPGGGLGALKNPMGPPEQKAFAAAMRERIRAFDAAHPRLASGRPPERRGPTAQAPAAQRGSGPPEPPPHDDRDAPPPQRGGKFPRVDPDAFADRDMPF